MAQNLGTRVGNGNKQPVCRYCGTLAHIIPDLRPADWHTGAHCVEGDEPIR